MFLPKAFAEPLMPPASSQAVRPGPTAFHTVTAVISALQASVDGIQQRLALQRQEYRAAQEHAAHLNQIQDDWEHLDVGGTVFRAGRAVLRRHGDHFLSLLVSDKFVCERAANGGLFLDRDPRFFALVLSYLRDGAVHVPPECNALRREAVFYGLQDLSRSLGPALCLAILPRDYSPAHVCVADTGWWRRVPCFVALHSLKRPAMAMWGGRLMALVQRDDGCHLRALDATSWTWESVCRCALLPCPSRRAPDAARAHGVVLWCGFDLSSCAGHLCGCSWRRATAGQGPFPTSCSGMGGGDSAGPRTPTTPPPAPPPPPGAFGQQLVAKGVALRRPWAPKAPDAP